MAANPAQHPAGREIIDLDGESTGSQSSVLEWQPSAAQVELDQLLTGPFQHDSSASAYQKCLKAVITVFPDISHDYVQQLWDKSTCGALTETDVLHQTLIEKILDAGPYPKEKDRLRELKKRKRASPEVEAARWKYADLRHDPEEYAKVAKGRLSERFHWVPTKFINEAFKEHSHFYGAFFAIDAADRKRDDSIGSPFQKLKSKRSSNVKSEQVMISLEAEGYDFEGLREEIRTAEARWRKEEDNRELAKARSRAKEASDEEYRRKGEIMECACCFSDDNPPTDMTHCDADTPHFFCFGCAKRNADADMASLKYSLRCMDQSRCEATFSRQERSRFLDASAIDKLERLQQQDEIRRAEMGDLEACPFCEYVAICPPPDVDRVFECQNPECMEASCRLCKAKAHIPLSCEEFKKENGVGERHAIEEARTEALIRSCKKCKVRILKEDGCNKVVCTNCYSVICDYCGEDITKVKYEHFDASTGVSFAKGRCPLYDASNRKEDQIEKAGKAALEKVRKENPGLSEDDLKIKFAKSVQDQSKRHRQMPDAPYPPLGDIRLGRLGHAQDRMHLGPAAVVAEQHMQALRIRQANIQARRQAQIYEPMLRDPQRPEADQSHLDVGLNEGEAQNRQRRNNGYYFKDLGLRDQVPHPPHGQLVNAARDQPLDMPRLGQPFDPLLAGGGMVQIDWQQQLIPQDLRPGGIGLEPPMPLNNGRQRHPRTERTQRDPPNFGGFEIIGRPPQRDPNTLREQESSRLDQLGRTPGEKLHHHNQRHGPIHWDPAAGPYQVPQPESRLAPHPFNPKDFEDNNRMLIAGQAQLPTPKPAQQRGQAQHIGNTGFIDLGKQRSTRSVELGTNPRATNVPTPLMSDQPPRPVPLPLAGREKNVAIDLEASPADWSDMPDWNLGEELPKFMDDQDFEIFLAGFGDGGQAGHQIRDYRGPPGW